MVATKERPIAVISGNAKDTTVFVHTFAMGYRKFFQHVSVSYTTPLDWKYSDVIRLFYADEDKHTAVRNTIIKDHIEDQMIPAQPYALTAGIWDTYAEFRSMIHKDDWHKFKYSNVFKPLREYKRYHQVLSLNFCLPTVYVERTKILRADHIDESLKKAELSFVPSTYKGFSKRALRRSTTRKPAVYIDSWEGRKK